MEKIKFCGLLFIGGILSLVSSCLRDNDVEVDDWALGNALIASFSLSSDSVAGLADVKFTIDQLNGKIYNKDSMRYGTVLKDKVLAAITFESLVSEVLIVEQATGDTVKTITDSINFSAPVMMTVKAYDGVSTKVYEAKLNIHQVNPDTMVWEKYADILTGRTFQDMKTLVYNDACAMYVVEDGVCQLYRSGMQDMTYWEKFDLSGFPDKALLSQMTVFEDALFVVTEAGDLYVSSDGQEWVLSPFGLSVKALLGYLPASTVTGRSSVLCCLVEDEGVMRFVAVDRQMAYVLGKEAPEAFPVSGFGHLNYETRYFPRLALASGRDSRDNLSDMAWATMDGLSWASLSNSQKTFTAREGAAVFYYDGCFFVVGGMDAAGNALDDIYFSTDQGVSWYGKVWVKNEDEGGDEYIQRGYYLMPGDCEARGFASALVDKNNYILLFGGKAKKDTNVLNEIWRGRINRLGFGKEN